MLTQGMVYSWPSGGTAEVLTIGAGAAYVKLCYPDGHQEKFTVSLEAELTPVQPITEEVQQ